MAVAAAAGLGTALRGMLRRRCVVAAVGNPQRGDDGAASELLKRLEGKTDATLLDTEDVPESYAGRIAALKPEVVLLVDAVDLGAEPGAAALLTRQELPAEGFSTHRPPLAMVMWFLERETGAEVLLLAIQPRQVEFGAPVSPEVERTVQALAALMTDGAPQG